MSVGIAGQMSLYDLLGSPPPPDRPEPEPQPQPERAQTVDQLPDIDVDAVPGAEAVPGGELESPAFPESPELPELQVEVTRSRRRKKTAEARLSGSVLSVRIPATSTADEERYFVDHFREKFERSRAASVVDLDQRAAELAKTYGLPTPTSIRWVANQKHQWGSCTPSDRSIRLSDRMAAFPRWVVDYVIVHELAHLVEADHSPAFWALVNAYPKTERARGYLLAKDGV